MKPKVEADRLIKKFAIYTEENSIANKSIAKQLALMCVEEIKKGITNHGHGVAFDYEVMIKKEEFWEKVEDVIKHS